MNSLSNKVRLYFFSSFASFLICSLTWQFFFSNYGEKITSSYRALRSIFRTDSFSELLLRDSLIYYQSSGGVGLSGFMRAFDENVHIAAVRAIDGPGTIREVYPYISNFSLQLTIPQFLMDSIDLTALQAYNAAQAISLVGMAFAVSLIFVSVRRDFGWRHAISVQAVFSLSPLFSIRAAEAYWMMFLSFLPFAVSLYLYPIWRSRWRFFCFLAIISFFVFLKSLTGYEYLSSVAMSAMIPVFLYQMHKPSDRNYWRRIIVEIIAIGIACFIGFMIAIMCHLLKMSLLFGNFTSGLQGIIQTVIYSSLPINGIAIKKETADLFDITRSVLLTFVFYNIHINLVIISASIWIFLNSFKARFRLSEKDKALLIALVFSLLSTVSWSLLMVNHAANHAHINWVQMYLCFYVIAAIALTELFRHRSRGNGPTFD